MGIDNKITSHLFTGVSFSQGNKYQLRVKSCRGDETEPAIFVPKLLSNMTFSLHYAGVTIFGVIVRFALFLDWIITIFGNSECFKEDVPIFSPTAFMNYSRSSC